MTITAEQVQDLITLDYIYSHTVKGDGNNHGWIRTVQTHIREKSGEDISYQETRKLVSSIAHDKVR